MSNSLELSNDRCVLYDCVMLSLASHYERKTRKDYGTKRGRPSTSASSSFAFDHPSSSRYFDEDDDENGKDAPPRPSNPLSLQSHPSLDITISLSPITPLNHLFETPSPPPPPQPPLMGNPIYFNEDTAYPCLYFTRNHGDLKPYTPYPECLYVVLKINVFGQVEMDDPNITMEEYIDLEAEKARSYGSTLVKMDDPSITVEEYIDLEARKARRHDFPSIDYKDALVSDHEIPSEPTIILSYMTRIYTYKLIFVNDLKMDSENDNDEVNISSDDVVIEQSDSGIDANVDTQPHEFDEGVETNHDIHRRSFNTKGSSFPSQQRSCGNQEEDR
nr:hypothetical protein [Tanacetum cinerariifolium]